MNQNKADLNNLSFYLYLYKKLPFYKITDKTFFMIHLISGYCIKIFYFINMKAKIT